MAINNFNRIIWLSVHGFRLVFWIIMYSWWNYLPRWRTWHILLKLHTSHQQFFSIEINFFLIFQSTICAIWILISLVWRKKCYKTSQIYQLYRIILKETAPKIENSLSKKIVTNCCLPFLVFTITELCTQFIRVYKINF